MDMKILELQQAISLLREVTRGSSTIRLLHELQLLRHQLRSPSSEKCEVTINRLKMKLQSKVERARRLEKNHKRLHQNGFFQRDAFTKNWVSKLSIQITFPPSESEIEQY